MSSFGETKYLNVKLQEGQVPLRKSSVFLVEDHAAVRHSLRVLLSELRVFDIVGETDTDPDATRLCGELRPDLIILDLRLPNLCAPDFAREIGRVSPKSRILCYSGYITREVGVEMMRRGVRGLVHKTSNLEVLFEAIDRVVKGGIYCDPGLGLPGQGNTMAETHVHLTSRELEVGLMIAEGLSTKEIAGRLGVSPYTVANHRSNLMQKLGAHDIVGVIRALRRRGFFNSLN